MSLTTAELEIANLALLKIGVTRLIQSPTESTNEQRVATAVYAAARDFVLADFPWDFAAQRALLANGAASSDPRWNNVFDYPTDCLRVRRVTVGERGEPIPFQVLNTGSAMQVFSNATIGSAYADFTVKVTDTTLFHPNFVEALTLYLASQMVTPLKVNPELGKLVMESYGEMRKQLEDVRKREGWADASVSVVDGTTATYLAICNSAIARIGYKYLIADPLENTDAARLCNLYFAEAVACVLREFPWPFARKRHTLVENNNNVTNWVFAYDLPTDFAYLDDLVSPYGRNPRNDQKIPYEIGFDSTDGVQMLYTDLEDAELLYISTSVSINHFDALFRDALSWRVASEVAVGLGADPKLAMYAGQRYMMALASAEVRALDEGRDDVDPDGEILSSRS